jgi:hypothetical protein
VNHRDDFGQLSRREIAAIASYLYQLLDDIDTADDVARSDDITYRAAVRKIQAKKAEVVASCDGYAVKFKPLGEQDLPVAPRLPDGTPGVRDQDATCDDFITGSASRDCDGDGHHLCRDCGRFSGNKSRGGPFVVEAQKQNGETQPNSDDKPPCENCGKILAGDPDDCPCWEADYRYDER